MDIRWVPVLADLRKRFAADTDAVEVEAYLSSQGYDRRQIGEILSLLYGESAPAHPPDLAGGSDQGQGEPFLRLQGPHERGRFTVDAWGYLTMLHQTGVIDLFNFEHIVERALAHVDGLVTLADIRAIAENVGLDDGAMSRGRSLIH